jgi:hypothetical protein
MPSSTSLSLGWVPIQKLTLINLSFPLTTLVDITEREKKLTCTQKGYRAKLERLCSVRLTRRDQKGHALNMPGFKWHKGLISLKLLPFITSEHVFSQVKVISINRFATFSKHEEVLNQYLILSCLDYKVVNIILMNKINIMKVELLRNDNNKQESLIFESVIAIQTNLDLAR